MLEPVGGAVEWALAELDPLLAVVALPKGRRSLGPGNSQPRCVLATKPHVRTLRINIGLFAQRTASTESRASFSEVVGHSPSNNTRAALNAIAATM